MIVYWLMMTLPLLFVLGQHKLDQNLKKIALYLFGIILTIVIGYRHEVGGDWFQYLHINNYYLHRDLNFFKIPKEHANIFLQWFSVNFLNGIYDANLISAVLFVIGLIRFSMCLTMPWVALLISIPFLIVVVSMGYTRQATAMGFIMWGLVDLRNRNTIKYVVSVIIASFFHLSAIVMLPIALVYKKNKATFFVYFIFIALMLFFSYYFYDQLNRLFFYYILLEVHESGGAVIRVAMNFFAAMLFFVFYDQFKEKFDDEKLWLVFSFVSILLFPLSFIYTTSIDRIAIFFIPIQLVVFSRLPLLIKEPHYRSFVLIVVLFIYASALFVWLFFGTHSNKWIPYQNLLTLY